MSSSHCSYTTKGEQTFKLLTNVFGLSQLCSTHDRACKPFTALYKKLNSKFKCKYLKRQFHKWDNQNFILLQICHLCLPTTMPVFPHLKSQLQLLGFPLHLLLPPVSPRLGSQPPAYSLSPQQGTNRVFVLQPDTSSLVKFTWNWPVYSETYYGQMSDNESYKAFFRKPNQKEDSKWFNWMCLV